MADNVYDYDVLEGKPQPNQAVGTWGDFAKTVGSSVLGTVEDLAAGAQYGFELGGSENGRNISEGFRKIFGSGKEWVDDTINPETRKLAAAALTSPEFLAHPVLGTALKLTGMTGSMAAIALPGGLVSSSIAATMVAGGMGGAINAGSGLAEFYSRLDKATNEELAEQSPKFKQMLEANPDNPKAVRSQFMQEAEGWAPALNVLFGAVTNAIGPGGVAARRMAGGTQNVLGAGGRGRLGAAGIGALEGAGTEAVESGTSDYLNQKVLVDAKLQKEIDTSRPWAAAGEGAFLGGIAGGAFGGALHRGRRAPLKAGVDVAGVDVLPDESAIVVTPPPLPAVGATGPSAVPGKSATAMPSPTVPAKGPSPVEAVGAAQVKDGTTGTPAKPVGVVTPAVGGRVMASIDPNGPDVDQGAAIAAARAPPAQPPVAPPPQPPPLPAQVTAPPVTQGSPQLDAEANRDMADYDAANAPPPAAPPPVAPVSTTRPIAAQPPPLDTGANVPESMETLRAQLEQIGQGGRKAVMFPRGTTILIDKKTKLPKGVRRHTNARGTFVFDPALTNIKEINQLSKAGRENELLGLGSISKPEVLQRVAAGEAPIAVTERTPEGTEVKAAAGTTATAPTQVAELEATKTPGNVVAVQTPESVLQMRKAEESRGDFIKRQNADRKAALKARVEAADKALKEKQAKEVAEIAAKKAKPVLRAEEDIDETAPIEVAKNLKAAEPAVPKGKNYRGKAGEERDAKIRAAEAVIAKHEPDKIERDFFADPVAEGAVIARATRMLDDARKEGVKIIEQIKGSQKGDALSDSPAMQILVEARNLIDTIQNPRISGPDRIAAVNRFWERDASIRKGYSSEVMAERRAEGEAKMRRGKGEDVEPESKAGRAVQLDAGTEGVGKETRAKAASDDKLAGDAERKAKLMAEMQAKYGKPGKPPTKSGTISEAMLPDPNPTPAQREAGNFRKGHRTVEGLDISLETIKGGIRRGVDAATGKPWQVKMPVDYGYIKRTEGADRTQIDVFDGRRGTKHFVIDQVDPNTGAFDEHKVMLRFKDEAAARAAYEASFSDGKGKARIGEIHEVSADELKAWLKSGDKQRSHLDDVVAREITEEDLAVSRPRRRAATAAEVLDSFDFSNLKGVNRLIAPLVKTQLKRLAGNVEVRFISPDQMAIESPANPNALGLHTRLLNDMPSVVHVLDTLPPGMGHLQQGHVILHELMHAVTVREIDNNPAFETNIIRLMQLYQQRVEKHFSGDEHASLKYAFTSTKEFIAEAFTNPNVQEVMARMPLSRAEAKSFGLDRDAGTVWDGLRNLVRRAIEKVTGRVQNGDTIFDAAMRLGDILTRQHEQVTKPDIEAAEKFRAKRRAQTARWREEDLKNLAEMEASGLIRSDALRSVEDTQRQITEVISRDRGPRWMPVRTFDNIAQAADRYFGSRNPVRKIQGALEEMRVSADKRYNDAEPMVRKLVELRAKYGEKFREFSSILHDSTVANVRPDIPLDQHYWLGVDALKGMWGKGQHARLAKRYEELVKAHPEFKSAWRETTNYFRDTQNEMSLGIIDNMLDRLGHGNVPGLAQRIHENKTTDADGVLLGDLLKTIQAAGELSKIDGTYVPLMRRGDHVVKGTIKVTQPGNSKKISDNEFEFHDRKAAEAYARGNDLHTTVKKVWVDENTGSVHLDDEISGEQRRVLMSDDDAVARYRATVQNQHVEFVDGHGNALKRAKELQAAGGIDVHEVVPRKYEPNGRATVDLSASLQALENKLKNSEAYKLATGDQKAALRAAIQEAALASHGSTRVSSRALPRRNVAGFSEDIVQNTADYAGSSSRYLARIEHGPTIEAGMKEMNERIKQDESKEGQYGRTTIANEVNKRMEGDNGFDGNDKFSPAINRLMSISFIDKLASPAYSLINAMQPGMVTMPYLAGRHGPLKSMRALARAYSDISALRIVGQGIKETGRRLKGSSAPDDFVTDVKARLKNANERALIDDLIRTGEIDPSSGMEIQRLVRDTEGLKGKLDTGLGYLEGVSREMPRSIEAINRLASAIAAYRLETSRGASHEAAVRYAKDTVNNTQFNYSPTNAPKMFNNPYLRPILQFKKYGQGMYQLIGTQIGKAYRNDNKGDRAEAVKSLLTLAATHMAMAGALGLPTEPIKYMIMAANAAGLPVGTWGDVENKIRVGAATALGKTGGELVTRGLPRALNLDLSRMGLDSVTSFGEPRSMKEADVKRWIFDNLAGPVVGLGGDWMKGLSHLTGGEYVKGVEKLVPIKAFSDSLRAYREGTEGKRSAAGRETLTPATGTEIAARVLGFGSGREAEAGALRAAYYSQTNTQKEARANLINDWGKAAPADKGRAMAAITAWNRGQPPEARVLPKDLTAKLKSDRKAEKEGVLGIIASKRDKRFIEEGVYSIR